MNNNYDFWFFLGVAANIAQLQSYELLLQDAKNDDLLDYLRHQDNDLLNKIIEQNEEIIELLRGGNKNEH